MATQVGEAVIRLTFDGKTVKASMNNVEKEVEKSGSKMGEKSGKHFGSKWGMAWAVAAGNLISKGISKVASMVSNTMDSAISRLDTLNNFPKVMESLGYSAETADKSIKQISDGLDGLPTSLDAMASDVQKLAASMGNLADGEVNATSVGLALNDMFLAGGKGTEAASAAMEQYNQMLARGKVDQQSWNSMVNAAPGQMNQLAKSILGANANQADLYKAMQKGTVSFDQLNDAMVKLDKEGGANFQSFADQAVAATGGIATQIKNISNTMNKIVAAALEGNLKDVSKYTDQLTKRVGAVAPTLIKGFSGAFNTLAHAIPSIVLDLLPAVIDGIKTMVEGLVDSLPDYIDMIREAGMRIFNALIVGIQDTAPDVIIALNEMLFTIISWFMDSVPIIIQTIAQMIPTIVEQAISVFNAVVNQLPEFLELLVNAILEALPVIMDAIINLMMAVTQRIPEIFPLIVSAIMQLIVAITQTLTRPDFLSAILKAALTLCVEMVKAIPLIITPLIQALPQIIANIVSFLLDPNNIKMILEAAVQLFMGIVMAVPQILGSLLGEFGRLISSLWDWITSDFEGFAANFGNFIGGIFKDAINNVISFIEGFINTPIDLINGFLGIINDNFGWLGVNIGLIDRVNLPRLAQGGVVETATTAIIGEDGQEAVIPLEKNTGNWAGLLAQTLATEMQEQGNGGTINVYMTNKIDNRLDAQDIGRVMMQSIRRAA